MTTTLRFALLYPVLALLLVQTGFSQFEDDALRLSLPGSGVGARPLSLGMAYSGIANDFSAAFWNPAGLAQIRNNEVSFGLSYNSYGNNSTYFGNSTSFTNSSTNINSIGLVYPFPTLQGSMVFALGFGRQNDLTTGMSFSGFNYMNSIAQAWAPDGTPVPNHSPSGNLAYELYLADSLGSPNFTWYNKILDSMSQAGKVLEGGGISYVTASAAIEAAKNLYLGATLDFITGSYTYTRNYSELSSPLASRAPGFDIRSIGLLESIESDISGFSVKLGMLYRFAPNSRLGLTIKTPSWITVRETYSQTGSSVFNTEPFLGTGTEFRYMPYDNVQNEYDVATPFVFTAALSHSINDLMLAGEIEYTDWTQMEFRNADQYLLNLNTLIKEDFRPTANLKAGAEYAFADAGFKLRGGFAYMPSPFDGDPSSYARKYITGGLGFLIENAVEIDLGFAHGSWDTKTLNYDYYDALGRHIQSFADQSISTNNMMATVSYRF